MLKYICLSDLHAGSVSSLLRKLRAEAQGTFVDDDISITTRAFQSALEGFLTAAGAKDMPPQLILLGDTLEMQYAKRADVAPPAVAFLKAINKKGLLAPEVIATAGNHDHALWTDARLSLDADTLTKSGDLKPKYRAATDAFEKTAGAKSRFLTALLEHAGFESCDLRYPNIGLSKDDRMVLLHHGHFVETEYRLMTLLLDALSETPRKTVSIETLAAENAGWMEFAWSALGDAAGLGQSAECLYQNMLTTVGFRRLSQRWAKKGGEALSEALPLSGNIALQEALLAACQTAIDVTLHQFRDTERYAVVDALTTDGLNGLRWFLEGPCAGQIIKEKEKIAEDITFVFGHTHKPFSERITVKGFPAPIKVYNTGGWALNGPRLDNAQGAAMILIDDHLNVASLRLFETPKNGEVPVAHVEMLSGSNGATEFRKDIESWLDASKGAWDRLARTTARAYEARRDLLLQLTEDAAENAIKVEAAQ